MNSAKEAFLKSDFISILKQLKGDKKGNWGVMNSQQMVEHFADAVKNASGKLVLPTLNEGEKLQKELDYFFEEFTANSGLKTRNPFFGKLNYEMNVQLLHKHAMHHLKQFGLV